MSMFSARRFSRVMSNDLLRVIRPVQQGTAAFLGVVVTLYLIMFERAGPADDPVHVALYGFCLICAGTVFTSVAFQDMHHPLQRNQYLMLPCSNLERTLSRYLLTGPLFIVYATLTYMAFDYVANQVAGMVINERQPLFSPFAVKSRWMIYAYSILHMLVFLGAICFRSHALLKTILFLALLLPVLVLFENIVERAFFPGLFSWSQFDSIRPLPMELMPWFTAAWMNAVFVIGAFAWLFYVACLCVRDHEATGGV